MHELLHRKQAREGVPLRPENALRYEGNGGVEDSSLTASAAGLPPATVLTLASGRSGQVSGSSKPFAPAALEAPLLRPLVADDDPFDVPFGRGSVDDSKGPPPEEKAPSSADASRRTTSARSFLSRARAARACRIEYYCQLRTQHKAWLMASTSCLPHVVGLFDVRAFPHSCPSTRSAGWSFLGVEHSPRRCRRVGILLGRQGECWRLRCAVVSWGYA